MAVYVGVVYEQGIACRNGFYFLVRENRCVAWIKRKQTMYTETIYELAYLCAASAGVIGQIMKDILMR